MAIAEQIKRSLDTVSDWSDQYTAPLGIVFHRVDLTNLDDTITRYASEKDWCKVLAVKRTAEIFGYSSPTLDEKVKLALANIDLFACRLPKMADGWWWNTYYHILNGFRYAKELSYETAKWSSVESAYGGLKNLRLSVDKYFHRCNPDTGAVERVGEGEWHQASALAGAWMKFYELGVNDALNMLYFEWSEFNRIFWKQDPEGNHYIYSTDNPSYEARSGSVFQTWIKAYKLYPFVVSENIPRIVDDLQYRYLAKGWDSPQWGGRKVVISHYPNVLQSRLDGTLEGWAVLHLFYKWLKDTAKSTMRNMLLGNGAVKASDALLSSDLFDSSSNRFRMTSDQPCTDRATCFGAAALFLMAVTPKTGCLAIPIGAEGLETYELEFLNPYHFSFNYERRQIMIPVYGGKISFTFGTKEVEANFPYDGIYTVSFSDDWNSITSTSMVGKLDKLYLVEPKYPTATEIALTALGATLAAFPIMYFGKEAVKKVKGG
jgi:hypothetical protein